MSASDTVSAPPILAAPPPQQGNLGLFQFVRAVRDSSIATYQREAYERDFLDRSFLWAHACIVNAPDGIKHVLLDNAQNYTKTRIARRLLEPGLGQGLLTSEGETWRRHRRIMAPSFDPRSVVGYAPIMTEHTERLVADWDALPNGAEIEVADAMMQTTLQIISRAMFSADSDDIVGIVSEGAERYQREVRPTLLDLLPLPRWVPRLPWRRGHPERIFSDFDRKLERMIAERGQAGAAERHDLLARLMAARDDETGGGMTAQEVRDQMATIFMAGHETTSLTMTWVWYLLSQHPEAEAKLHAELAGVLGGRTPRHDDVAKLSYARTVIDEAMRLYPPAHTLSREAIAADDIVGHRIPAGASVYIVPWLLHRHRKLWERPDRFEPERFGPERSDGRHRFAYIPFGAGPRICIGAAFAITEAVLILATIAQRYRLRLKPGHPVDPQGLITLRPRYGMKMLLERR
jgi:cytochrome P450